MRRQHRLGHAADNVKTKLYLDIGKDHRGSVDRGCPGIEYIAYNPKHILCKYTGLVESSIS